MAQTLIILAGIAGSGKSTYADKLAKKIGAMIVSTDKIRGELCGGDETDQSKNGLLFNVVIPQRITKALNAGESVIYDATNVTVRDRNAIRKLAASNVLVECHYIPPDVKTAKKQNLARARFVPEFVIDKHAEKWVEPSVSENFDKVVRIVHEN